MMRVKVLLSIVGSSVHCAAILTHTLIHASSTRQCSGGDPPKQDIQVYKKQKDLQGCSLMEGEGIDGRAIIGSSMSRDIRLAFEQGETMEAMLGLGLFSGPGVAPRNQSMQYGNQQPPTVQTSPSTSKQSSQSTPVDFGDAFVPAFDLGNDNGISEIGAGATGQRAPPSGTMTQGVKRVQPTGAGSIAEPKVLVRALGESLHERLLKLLDGKSFSVVGFKEEQKKHAQSGCSSSTCF